MRIIVGISGASGVMMGYALMHALRQYEDMEIHLVVTEGAKRTWDLEADLPYSKLEALADVCHSNKNLAASISSGSYETDGMIIIPCSMKTLAGVAYGFSENLIIRAADVCLKEGRKVVLVPREMPFGKVHIRNMKEASDLGCIIVPPMLTFYNKLDRTTDQVNHVLGKILMQFGISPKNFTPWEGVQDE